MQEISPKNSRVWSRLGQSGTICGIALPEILSQREDCYVMTADLGHTVGLSRVMENFEDRFVNVGIAEQNLIGVASGMAFDGAVVFATTFATFITMRCYEQIRHNLGYQKANVKLIGFASGTAMGMFGNTHYSLEDLAIMRAIPNMVVLSPADASEAYLAVNKAAEYEGPVYIRLSGNLNTPIVYKEPYTFQIGKAVTLRQGEHITLIAAGAMVCEAQKAADRLQEKGIAVGVINMHTIKPLDTDVLDDVSGQELIVTIEEHNVIGGLGSAVAEYYARKEQRPRQIMIGIEDQFVHPGESDFVRKENGLDAESICNRIIKEMS